jgi:serine phosphatase RsbU (regulator of sigma subunit)
LGSSATARLGWCLAGALAIFGFWIAIGSTSQIGISFFYVVPVGLATWWFGWRLGLCFALGCIGLYALGAAIHPVHRFGGSLLVRSIILAGVVAVFAAVRRRMAELEHSAEELEAIRMALTPPSMPSHAGVEVAAAFIPSELGVSGDFYLLTNSPDGSTIAVVGDVVGHGPKAARLATFVRAQIATFAANSSDPAEILSMANSALLERSGGGRELVSAVCMRFDSESGELSWAVAGHPLPLELPSLSSLDASGHTQLLGIEESLPLATEETRLEQGEGVLVYTDGTTDVRIEEDSMLGLEGLQRLLAPVAGLPAEHLVGEIEETLLDRAHGAIQDDICVLVMRPSS